MQPLEHGRETGGRRTSDEPRNWTLKPVARHQIVMCGIGAAFIGAAIWFAIGGLQTPEIGILFAALICMSLGGFLVATALTLRLVLTPEHLAVRALWRIQWSLPRRRVEIRELTDGPGRPPSGWVIIDIESEKVVRQIPTGQFPASDMRRLAELFAPRE